ncbi:MAG: glycosyl hydrolase [Bacteroidota bacterium]
MIEKAFRQESGTPVFTRQGKYMTQGWTEWTQGFQFGSSLLQYEATDDNYYLNLGRIKTFESMTTHVGHFGVHDHGFNNLSTYGNLWRLMDEGKIPNDGYEKQAYELALKISGAVQAKRWTSIEDGGYIYSFNGPHSLFVDTIRSCRSLIISHLAGHKMLDENDVQIDLIHRSLTHMETTAKYNIYYGKNRDRYDIPGRVAHESIFNVNDGKYRCPNSQQGYSGFTTWTRGLAWAILGFAEQLEFLDTLPDKKYNNTKSLSYYTDLFLEAASITADFYIENSFLDGIPYWDTGAPNIAKNYQNYESNPEDGREPVDSSAAVIAAQGFLRLGNYLDGKNSGKSKKYYQAGLTVAHTIFNAPYISENEEHNGLILHSIYHWPNGWDFVPKNSKIPYGESSMWGDYHARELALYLHRILNGEKYLTFFLGWIESTKTA